jgi:hypothetical protein
MPCLTHTPGLAQTAHGTIWHTAPLAGWSWPTTLRSFIDALREGFVAWREYERLRARGITHDLAIRQALGIGLYPPVARDTAHALYFAGRA